MIDMIIYDKINKEQNNIYFHYPYVYGINYSSNGVKRTDNELIKYIFDNIVFNKNCKLQKEENEYKVYKNSENGLLHFVKDGKEDANMFVKYNMEDAILYTFIGSRLADVSHKEQSLLKLIIKNDIVFATFNTFVGLLSAAVVLGYSYNISALEVSKNVSKYVFLPAYYEVAEGLNVNLDRIDAKIALDLINNSNNVSEEQKEILSNEDLLNDVFLYYEDSVNKYLIRDKLNEIKINYNPNLTRSIIINKDGISNYTVLGYYNPALLNIISSTSIEGMTDSSILGHEFVHLLQNNYDYLYLKEGSAELIASEYFNHEPKSYYYQVENLKLLMDIVGPKEIWKLNFSNDMSVFNILKENLSQKDYKKIMEIFRKKPNLLNDGDNQIVTDILYKLAKNSMSESEYEEFTLEHSESVISDTNDIDGIKKYYFNSRKMADTETIHISDVKYYYAKEVSVNEYVKALNEGKIVEFEVWGNPNIWVDKDKLVVKTDTGEEVLDIIDAVNNNNYDITFRVAGELMPEEYFDIDGIKDPRYFDTGGIKKNNSRIVTKDSFKKDDRYQINPELDIPLGITR